MDIVTSEKMDFFRMCINPEVCRHPERVYTKNSLTLIVAVNVFFWQPLNAGGLPFQLIEDNAVLLQAKALSRLMKELEEALNDPSRTARTKCIECWA